tara:strand:+ start:180 stop:998 length:819 start_codon:yes stop_codon:yes gene_type:complete
VIDLHLGWVSVVSRRNTYLKKRPVSLDDLTNDEKARIMSARAIRRCRVLDRVDDHTYLETGLGEWWVIDAHWDGLTTEKPEFPYDTDGHLKFLKDFPYEYQESTGEGWKLSQSAAITTCLCYLNIPTINSHDDYLRLINKHGKPTSRQVNVKALEDLNIQASYSFSFDDQDIREEIDKGKPVVAKVLIDGSFSSPYGRYQFLSISGYGADYWLVQNPLGRLDVENGDFLDRGASSGKDNRHSFEHMNPRFMAEGGSSGECWFNFRSLKGSTQ